MTSAAAANPGSRRVAFASDSVTLQRLKGGNNGSDIHVCAVKAVQWNGQTGQGMTLTARYMTTCVQYSAGWLIAAEHTSLLPSYLPSSTGRALSTYSH
jgi:hypothetical protein